MAGRGYSALEYMSPDIERANGSTYQIRVGVAQVQGPNVACKAVLIRAASANANNVYVNWKTGVKVLQAATDALVGMELDAGQDTGWIPSGGNLNNLFFIAGAANQDVTLIYLV